jgi:hypothetical protein
MHNDVVITIFLVLFVLQAHFSRAELPISDYVTDLKSVLDQSIRIIQAMIDVCANSGWLTSALTCMHLLQMIIQVNCIGSAFLFQIYKNDSKSCIGEGLHWFSFSIFTLLGSLV